MSSGTDDKEDELAGTEQPFVSHLVELRDRMIHALYGLVAAVIVPAWLLLTYFAEPIIRVAFTDAYVAATPFFQVFLLLMVRHCFPFSTLLRSVGDNASFATSSAIALVVNGVIIVALMPRYGLWGPTLGLAVSTMWTAYYLCRRVMARYGVPLSAVFHWRKLGCSLLSALLALGITHGLLGWLPRGAAGTLLSLAVFGVVYALAARLILREEYGYVVRAFTRRRAAT